MRHFSIGAFVCVFLYCFVLGCIMTDKLTPPTFAPFPGNLSSLLAGVLLSVIAGVIGGVVVAMFVARYCPGMGWVFWCAALVPVAAIVGYFLKIASNGS